MMRASRVALRTVPVVIAALLSSPAVAGTPAPTCDGLPATIVGTDGPDHLTGTPGNDVIVGLGGDDVIHGGGGDDVICGGDGADRLFGGAGDDRLFGQLDRTGGGEGGAFTVGDVLDGGPGDDHLDGGADIRPGYFQQRPDTYSFASARHGVVVDLMTGTAHGEGRDTLVTEAAANGVIGSAYDDTLTGSAADDTLVGSGGDDTISGGAGDDHLYGEGTGPRAADGTGDVTGEDDVLRGGPGDDTLNAYAGRDTLDGGPGDDFLVDRSPLPETVSGGAGRDVIDVMVSLSDGMDIAGGPGNDYLELEGALAEGRTPEATDDIDLRTGTTSLTGVGTDAPVTGAVAGISEYRLADTLHWVFHGDAGDNRVWALDGGPLDAFMGAGDDYVFGSNDSDSLHGGPGTDTVVASPGDDTCTGFEVGSCHLGG